MVKGHELKLWRTLKSVILSLAEGPKLAGFVLYVGTINYQGVGEIAYLVKAPAIRPNDLRSILGPNGGRRELSPESWPLTSMQSTSHTCT